MGFDLNGVSANTGALGLRKKLDAAVGEPESADQTKKALFAEVEKKLGKAMGTDVFCKGDGSLKELEEAMKHSSSANGSKVQDAYPRVCEKYGKQVEDSVNKVVSAAMENIKKYFKGEWTPELAAKVEKILTEYAENALDKIDDLALDPEGKWKGQMFDILNQEIVHMAENEIEALPEFQENNNSFAASQGCANAGNEIGRAVDSLAKKVDEDGKK